MPVTADAVERLLRAVDGAHYVAREPRSLRLFTWTPVAGRPDLVVVTDTLTGNEIDCWPVDVPGDFHQPVTVQHVRDAIAERLNAGY